MDSDKHLILAFSLLFALICMTSRGQFNDSSSGLLSCPSAEMPKSGTFMATGLLLNRNATAPAWNYNTIGYGISVVILPRIEIGYVMTIFNGKWAGDPNSIFLNQDRHFYGKVQLLKEGEFGKEWIPSLAVGISDPTTGETRKGDIDYTDFDVAEGNGYFNRYYAVATKHFYTPHGVVGAHLGYQYNKRVDIPMNGPCAAIDWMPVWLQKENVVATKLIAEYDARTFNVGAIISLWRDHFEAMFELQAMKWISAGIRYKLVLKS